MQSFKLVLVGDSGVGKTPLIWVFENQSSPPPSVSPPRPTHRRLHHP